MTLGSNSGAGVNICLDVSRVLESLGLDIDFSSFFVNQTP